MNAVSSVVEYIKELQKNEISSTGKKEESLLEEYSLVITKSKDALSDNDIARGKEYVNAFIKDKNSKCTGQISKHFYRGHFSTEYQLIPSIYRKNEIGKEEFYFHEMAVRCPEHFKGKSHLDRLVTMQHYDCPTRLLDVTSNPLVALYFACKNYGCPICNKSNTGVVYVFSVLPQDVVYSDSSRAIMLSCLAKFTSLQKEELCSLAEDWVDKGSFPKKKSHEYQDNIVEKLYQEVKKELPGFNRNIRPLDLLKPLFVQPDKTNSRISKQDGAFILYGLSDGESSAESKIIPTVEGKILIHNQHKLLEELNSIGINEASLFPELDKVAHYLKSQKV